MSSIAGAALRSGNQTTPAPGSYTATVARDGVKGEPLVLVIKGPPDEESLEIVADNWVPKLAGTPVVGDECLLELDSEGKGWVTAWAGQGG